MPTSKNLSPKKKKLLEKVYAICTNSQKKYGYTDQKREKCILGLSRRFNIHGSKKVKVKK